MLSGITYVHCSEYTDFYGLILKSTTTVDYTFDLFIPFQTRLEELTLKFSPVNLLKLYKKSFPKKPCKQADLSSNKENDSVFRVRNTVALSCIHITHTHI